MTNAYQRAMGIGGLGAVDILGAAAEGTDGQGETYQYTANRDYTKGYRIDFGFGFDGSTGLPAVIPNGARREFAIHPRTPFKPSELIIPSEIAPGLFLANLEHADRKYVDGDPIPASTYSEVSTRKELELPTVDPSDRFIVEILNISGAAVGFYAMFRGKKVTQ